MPTKRSISTPPFSDTMRSEMAVDLRTEIRKFAPTPDPLPIANASPSRKEPLSSFLSMKDRNLLLFRDGLGGGGVGGGAGGIGFAGEDYGYIPPPNAMRVSKGNCYGLGAPPPRKHHHAHKGGGGGSRRSSLALAGGGMISNSRRSSLVGKEEGLPPRRAFTSMETASPSSLMSASPSSSPQRQQQHNSVSLPPLPFGAKGLGSPAAVKKQSPRLVGGGGGANKANGGATALATSSSPPQQERRSVSSFQSTVLIPFRKRRNVPTNNGTSIFTDHVNQAASAALGMLLSDEQKEDADQNGDGDADAIVRSIMSKQMRQSPAPILVQSPNSKKGDVAVALPTLSVTSPTSRIVSSSVGPAANAPQKQSTTANNISTVRPRAVGFGGGSPSPAPSPSSPLPPLASTPLSRKQQQQQAPPLTSSAASTTSATAANLSTAPSPRTARGGGVERETDTELLKAMASLSAIKASIDGNEERSREAYARAIAYRTSPTVANGDGDGGEEGGGANRRGGQGGAPQQQQLIANARVLAQQQAFLEWRKECNQKLIEGREAPVFLTAKAFKMGPKSSIGAKVHELRADPSKWYEFTDGVAKQRKQKMRETLAMGTFMTDNITLLPSLSPERRAPRLEAMGQLRDARIAEAAEKRVELRELKLQSIEEKEAHRQERIRSRYSNWMKIVVLGAFASRLHVPLTQHRLTKETEAKKNAVAVFEDMWRKRNFQLSHPRAFIIRARFLRRCLTRVRARILMDRYADRMKNLLKNVTFYTRILVAFSHFHGRVVKGQRLWRSRIAMMKLQTELRKMQWTDTAQRRAADIVMHIGRLRTERNILLSSSFSAAASPRSRKGTEAGPSFSLAVAFIPQQQSQQQQGNANSGGRVVTTLGSVMLPSRSPSLGTSLMTGRMGLNGSRGGGGGSMADEDPLTAAENELEDLRSISDETRDRMLENYLVNQRNHFRQEWRKRDDYIAQLNKKESQLSAKELAQRRHNIPPKPRWKMILSDEVVVNMIRQATRQQRQISGSSSFAFPSTSPAYHSAVGGGENGISPFSNF